MRTFGYSLGLAVVLLAGCRVDVPELNEGPFACTDNVDCADGYYCDLGQNECVANSDTETCTGSSCLATCSTRGATCTTATDSTGVCARVRLTSASALRLYCVPCPLNCSTLCAEATGEDKLFTGASICPSATACTDRGCPCASSEACSPTLICRNQACVDPCDPWPCSNHEQACLASQSTSSFTCTSDCTTTGAKCYAVQSEGWTCDLPSKSCINTNATKLQVLSVQPAVASKVPASILKARILFNMPILASTITDSTVYIETTSGRVPCVHSLADDGFTIELTPTSGSFNANTTYTINVRLGLTCTGDMQLDRETISPFTTL